MRDKRRQKNFFSAENRGWNQFLVFLKSEIWNCFVKDLTLIQFRGIIISVIILNKKIMAKKYKYMTKPELDLFFDTIDDNKRNLIMFELMYTYGLRVGEVVQLKVGDIATDKDQEGNVYYMININALKKGISGRYSLTERMFKKLRAYMKEYGLKDYDDPLFRSERGGHISKPQIYRLFRHYADYAGLHKDLQHPHVLRHSIAVHMADRGIPAEKVQMHLRHKEISNTMIYYQITSEARRKTQTEMLNNLDL